MTIEALRQYILTQGASQNDVTLEWDKFWALNKKVIDLIAPRHTSIIKAIHKSKTNPDIITRHELQLHLEGDFKKTKKKISWSAETTNVSEVTLVDYSYLINKRKVEEEDYVKDFVTEKTEFVTHALA